MTIELAKKLLSEYDGNHSMIYPIIKDEIDKLNLTMYENPYPNEFIFFEDDYLNIYLDMVQRGIPKDNITIIDIGCQNGFQSYIFEGYNYIGIDPSIREGTFFRERNNYIRGKFSTEVHFDEKEFNNSIVISNMSLGYFNTAEITDEVICESLKGCKYLYIATRPELIEMLKPHFDVVKYFKDGEFPRLYMGKE